MLQISNSVQSMDNKKWTMYLSRQIKLNYFASDSRSILPIFWFKYQGHIELHQNQQDQSCLHYKKQHQITQSPRKQLVPFAPSCSLSPFCWKTPGSRAEPRRCRPAMRPRAPWCCWPLLGCCSRSLSSRGPFARVGSCWCRLDTPTCCEVPVGKPGNQLGFFLSARIAMLQAISICTLF